MKFGPSRGNPFIIFENFLKNFGLLLLALIFTIFKGPGFIKDNITILIIAMLSPVSALIKYLFTKYSIDDEKMTISSGLFVKKTMEIPLKNITTVDMTQNLLFQLFHVYKIKADNASLSGPDANQAELVLVLKQESAYYVKSLLESRTTEAAGQLTADAGAVQKPVIKSSLSDFILLGTLKSKFVYFLAIITALFGGGGYINRYISKELKISEYTERFMNYVNPAVALIIILLTAYIISLLASIFVTAVKYYDYSVIDRGDALFLQYGLFTKKSYTLMKEKISGVNVKQPLLMRFLGYCSVEVYLIGYGDQSDGNNKEISLIYPIAKRSEVGSVLEKLFPEMSFRFEYHSKHKGTLHYFFLCFRMAFAVVLPAGILIFLRLGNHLSLPVMIGAIAGGLAFLLFMCISVYLEYCNTGINQGHNCVAVRKGGLSLDMIFIKTEKLESITESATVWKHQRGFTSIELGFVAPTAASTLYVKNIAFADYEKVKAALNY